VSSIGTGFFLCCVCARKVEAYSFEVCGKSSHVSRMANAFFFFRLVHHAVVNNLIMQDREKVKRATPLNDRKKSTVMI